MNCRELFHLRGISLALQKIVIYILILSHLEELFISIQASIFAELNKYQL